MGSPVARRAGPLGPSQWDVSRIVSVGSTARSLDWCPLRSVLGCALPTGVCVLCETVLFRKISETLAAVQLSTNQVQLEREGGSIVRFTAGVNIKGMDVTKTHVLVHNRKTVEVFSVATGPVASTSAGGSAGAGAGAGAGGGAIPAGAGGIGLEAAPGVTKVASFNQTAHDFALYADTIFACSGGGLLALNFRGTVKLTIPYTEKDGEPRILATKGRFLALATATGVIHVYDVSRAEPKLLHFGRFENLATGQLLGDINSLAISAEGECVSIVASRAQEGAGAMRCVRNRTL